MTVTALLPSAGSSGGGAVVKVVGTGLMQGITVKFDGANGIVRAGRGETLYVETPAHSPGAVDVLVTTPDGRSQRLASGFTYVPPESFDPNGVWGGFTLNGEDSWVQLEIRDNKLVSASCSYDAKWSFAVASSPTVEDGAFSFTAEDGATISGRVVSPSEILGTISFPLCRPGTMGWRATPESDWGAR